MSFGPARLLESLQRLEQRAAPARRFVIALSGGLDSTVLADALCQTSNAHNTPLLAVHIDHGLQPGAANFAACCEAFAEQRSLPFECIRVDVDQNSGQGLEAAARDARYAAFEHLIAEGDWLLSAHHQDDQAETLLLNLLRGSGPLGVAAMPALRRFGNGWLVRPMLDVSREQLQAYASGHSLAYAQDPSNADTRFDRNFLRQDILPRLADRWPDAAGRLARSAALAGDAADLLDALADLDLEPLLDPAGRCAIEGLKQLPASRQRNAIRRLVRQLGLAVPGSVQLEEILASLIAARDDALPRVSWAGGEARRFRGRLYLMAPLADAALPEQAWRDGSRLDLGPDLGHLQLETVDAGGIDPGLAKAGLTVRARRGGEEIRLESHGPTRKLKKLLNEYGVVPWMRDRLPLVYSGDRLVAVANLWVAAEAYSQPGLKVCWHDGPRLD